MEIGMRIKKRREELGMTQDELAKKLGYANRSSVNKVENSREVSMKKINAYANALNVTVANLMGWTEGEISVVVDIDTRLNDMPEHLKLYALKLAEMSKEKQEFIMQSIDMLEKKE